MTSGWKPSLIAVSRWNFFGVFADSYLGDMTVTNTGSRDTESLLQRAQQGDPTAVNQLLGQHRDRLREIERMSVDEIASSVADPVAIVKSRMSRALEQLHQILKPGSGGRWWSSRFDLLRLLGPLPACGPFPVDPIWPTRRENLGSRAAAGLGLENSCGISSTSKLRVLKWLRKACVNSPRPTC